MFPETNENYMLCNTGGHYKLHERSTGFAGNAHMVQHLRPFYVHVNAHYPP